MNKTDADIWLDGNPNATFGASVAAQLLAAVHGGDVSDWRQWVSKYHGDNMTVYKDDGEWGKCPWFMRSNNSLSTLFVERYVLAHLEGTDDPEYTSEQWAKKSAQLVERHPGCIFVYCQA